jgi:hypothetical protein
MASAMKNLLDSLIFGKTHGFLFSIKAIQRKDPLTEFGHFLKVRWDIQFRTT